MIKYLLEKEFKYIFRNSFIPKIIIAIPLLAVLVFPWAVTQEITNIKVDIVDRDHSAYSQRLTQKIAASTYFLLTTLSATNEDGLQTVNAGKADVILDIPPGFEKNWINDGKTTIFISANAVNGTKGALASNYLGGIIRDYADELRSEHLPASGFRALPVIHIVAQNRFNVFLDYKIFMIPALLVMLLTIICGFLPALNIVSEKEFGTIEQINVTPVGKFTFIISKLIPYWIIGFLVLNIYLGIAALIYGLYPAGNMLTVYLLASIYILTLAGVGLVISNYSASMQQAMFVMFFFLMVMIMISGLFTPVTSMPQWAQHLTIINPLKYFIQGMRMVYLKGSNASQIGTQFIALLIFAAIFNTWAVISYKKSS